MTDFRKKMKIGIVTILLILICVGSVAAAPVADFTGTPTTGIAPLAVSFTDSSSNNPTGWAWFFGDETYTQAWTQQTVSAGWVGRTLHTSVAMPDGSIVLMGGYDNGMTNKNDVWRSTDNGATWTQQTASAGWTARWAHSSVAMPDGSIVLMGGDGSSGRMNDVWRSTDNGATWTRMTANAGWSARSWHTSVAMPDGSIVLMGGYGVYSELTDWGNMNDVWRSTDNGATWTRMTAAAGWGGRISHSSVVMSDSSIVLIGGGNLDISGGVANDVWRSTDNGATWTQITAAAGWEGRYAHTSVAMPDGSIVLMGGAEGNSLKNDVWRSTDNGATWTQVSASSGWTARRFYSSVAMSDGSIVLMGGASSGGGLKNDVWRLMPVGSSVQNPSHTYTTMGIYKVALGAYNAGGHNSIRKPGYITVTTTNPSTPTPTPTIPAEGGSTTTVISANVQQQLSVAITNPFTGNWALSQGANSQNYGSLTITANVPWSESTSATNGDYLKNSGGAPLTNKLQMNAADVTAYTTSGTGSSSTLLNFAQQVVMADPAGSYGTVVTFTVNAV